jgi:hypothetical protein
MAYTFIGEESNKEPSQGKYTLIGDGEQESALKSSIRTGLQVPLGLAKKATFPLDLYKAWAIGEGLSDIEELRTIPGFNEEKYRSALGEAVGYIPTQDTMESFVEKHLGIPLTPKTSAQKTIRTAAETAGLTPGNMLTKTIAGGTQPVIESAMKEAGVPEAIASPLSQVTAGGAGAVFTKTPRLGANSVESLQPSMIETAKKAKGFLPEEAKIRGEPISKKVTAEGEKLGIELPELRLPTSTRQQVGRTISPNRFQNSTHGGKEIKSEIASLDKEMYSDINKKYTLSRSLNKDIEDIHPELVDKLNARLTELEAVPSLSGPRASVKKTIEDLIDRLSVRTPNGGFDYKPISNQSLIDQVQNLREKIDFDFAHGSPKNIIKPVISDINEAAIKSAGKHPTALKALQDANSSYAEWADVFDNDIIRPFRDKSNKQYSGLYKASSDLDKFNVIKDALSRSEKGIKLSNSLKRDIVESRLMPYFEDMKKTLGEGFQDTISELEAVASPKELGEIKNILNKNRKFMGQRFLKKAKFDKTAFERLKSWATKPENILKVVKTAGGASGALEVGKLMLESTK